MATRDLTIITTPDKGVSRNTALILTFVPVNKSAEFRTQFPVVWKLIRFLAGKSQAVTVTYSARLGVGVTQVDRDVVQYPASFVEMELGQTTTYTSENGSGVFSEPQPKPAPRTGDTITALNKTSARQSMSVGTINNDVFESVLFWSSVNVGDALVAQFTPKLQFYDSSAFRESQVIRGEIQADTLLGEWNLEELNTFPNSNIFRLWDDGGKLRLDYDH